MAGGTKRRRKGASSSASSTSKQDKTTAPKKLKADAEEEEEEKEVPSIAAAAAAPNENSRLECIVSRLLQFHQEEAMIKAALERLWEGKSSLMKLGNVAKEPDIEGGGVDDDDDDMKKAMADEEQDDTVGYWILLATHTLESLARNPSRTRHKMQTMAWLSFALAPLAVPAAVGNLKSNTERLAFDEGRHVLGRALLAAACGALQVLKMMHAAFNHDDDGGENDEDEWDKNNEMAVLAAVLALDQTVHLIPLAASATDSATNNSNSTTGCSTKGPTQQANQVWDQARSAFTRHLRQYWDEREASNEEWSARKLLGDNLAGLEECLEALQNPSPTPPRNTGRRKAAPATSPTRKMQDLLKTFSAATSFYRMDDYTTANRWVGIALSHYGSARTLLLEASTMLLNRRTEFWECSLAPVAAATATAAAAAEDDNDANKEKKPAAREKTTTRKRKKAPSTADDDISDNNEPNRMPSVVALVTVASRLVKILREVGGSSCDRPFTGVVKNYMQLFWIDKAPAKSKKTKPVTNDARDLATVFLYEIVQVHFRCLENLALSHVVSDGDQSEKVVNDAEDPTALPLIAYYPFVSQTISQLLTHVSLVVTGVAYDEQYQMRARLECAAAAFVLECYVHSSMSVEYPCIDARLMMFAVLQLTIALNKKAEDHNKVLEQVTGLPVPALPSSTKRKRKSPKNAGGATHCSYAGVYPEEYEHSKVHRSFRGDSRLALFLRAMPSDKWDQRIGFLVTSLLELVEGAYDTRRMEVPTEVVTFEEAKADAIIEGRTKTKNQKSGRGSNEKRRKTSSTSVLPYRRISSTRASLASECLDALSLCLRYNYADAELTNLQLLMRHHVSMDHMCRMIDLCDSLGNLFPKTQQEEKPVEAKTSLLVTKEPFSSQERKLWSSHINMCLCLGRGRPFRVERTTRLLGEKRLELYKRVALIQLGDSADERKKQWPLWLPPALGRFVAANLDCEERHSGKDYDADRYIVDGAVAMITSILRSISSFDVSGVSTNVLAAYDNVPLSLENTRLILLAFANLPMKTRESSFKILVESVTAWMVGLASRPDDEARVREEKEVAGFVARVVAFCSNAYSLMRFGPHFRRELNDVIGRTLSSPRLYYRNDPSYSADKSFSSVLENWEFADYTTAPLILDDDDSSMGIKLHSLLSKSFELGFLTAPVDRGHLLYVSWNSLGKSELWRPISCIAPIPAEISEGVPSLVLDLRNDICFAHRAVCHATERPNPSTPLLSAMESRETRKSKEIWAWQAKKNLSEMINKASTLVARVKEELLVADNLVRPELICLCAAITSYVSFAVASLTISRENFFSTTYEQLFEQASKRRRGYSTGSENTASDAEDSNESQDFFISTYERLQDVCDTFGAAPSHPDWLDKECRLLDTVSFESAVEMATKAQLCISDLVAIGIQHVRMSQRNALRVSCKEPQKTKDLATSLAVELCWLQSPLMEATFDSKSNYGDDWELTKEISKACNVDDQALKILFRGVSGWKGDSPDMHWTKATAQRVQGRLQHLFRSGCVANYVTGAELRASGEWEVLLAKSLSPAIAHENIGGPSAALVLQTKRWEYLLWSAVDALCPTSALLRYSLSRGGRNPHVLSSLEFSTEDYDPSDPSLQEDVPSSFIIGSVAKNAVLGTLCLLFFALPEDSTCSAIAMQLVPDISTFTALQDVGVCRGVFASLDQIQNLVESRSASKRHFSSGILDLLALIIDKFQSKSFEDESTSVKYRTLFAAFGVEQIEGGKSIASPDVNLDRFQSLEVLKMAGVGREAGDDRLAVGLASFVIRGCASASQRALASFASSLYSLVQHNYNVDHCTSPFLVLTINLLNQGGQNGVSSLIERYICDTADERGSEGSDVQLRDSCSPVCRILSLVLSAKAFKWPGTVAEALRRNFAVWSEIPWMRRIDILFLFYLSAASTGKLDEIGNLFISSLQLEESNTTGNAAAIENFAHFCTFAAALQSALRGETDSSAEMLSTHEHPFPNSCSYAKYSDFREQHWYQCYTCGLTGDRGCCTLCALVCHKGHDVVYARHSSFFCDCGAEQRFSEQTGRRLKCQCLKQLSPSEAEDIYNFHRKTIKQLTPGGVKAIGINECVEIASRLGRRRKNSFKSIFSVAPPSNWSSLVFDHLASEFALWKSSSVALLTPATSFESLRNLRGSLRRRACSTDVILPGKSFHRSCFFQEGSLNTNVSPTRRIYLEDRGMSRCAVDTDPRGRFAFVETTGVLFCNGLPLACMEAQNEQLSRNTLPILSSVRVYFDAFGVRLSQAKEGLVIVWGAEDLLVLEMEESFKKCKRRIDLSTHLRVSGGRTNSIIHCYWIDSSSGCLAVGCRHALFIFDLKKSDNGPQIVVRTPDPDTEFVDFTAIHQLCTTTPGSFKLFALLDDWSLHEVRVRLPANGESLGNYLLSGVHLRIPVAKPVKGIEYVSGGKKMFFLEQSRTLVIQDENVYGLPVDMDGEIDRAFVLVPEELSSAELITLDNSQGGVKGPYTHWKELGLVQNEGSTSFRIVCVGHCSLTRYPVLLSVEFNESTTKMTRIEHEPDIQRERSNIFVDGLATFSVPMFPTADWTSNKPLQEKLYLMVLCSKGSLSVCKESAVSFSSPSVEPRINRKGDIDRKEMSIEPAIPLLAFENLKNVTDSTDLFLDDSVGESSDQIKTKLLRDNELCLRSPNLGMFTLNVAINDSFVGTDGRKSHAIAAIRILFGATSFESIPRYAIVQGRKTSLLPYTKRWYAFHLTTQEVLLGIRSGMISISLGPSFDGTTRPVIDALETFAMERKGMDEWIPTSLRTVVAADSHEYNSSSKSLTVTERFRILLSAMTSLNRLFDQVEPSERQVQLLTEIVQDTALQSDGQLAEAAKGLVFSFQGTIDDCQAFVDNGVVSACDHFLARCDQVLKDTTVVDGGNGSFICWHHIRPTFRACLKVAAGVARYRPSNYLKTTEGLAESVAMRAGKLMDSSFIDSVLNVEAVADFVELSFLEIALARAFGVDYDVRGKFAGFDVLQRLLLSQNRMIVQSACKSISNFCERYSSFDKLGSDETDLFAAKPMIVHYECDGCGKFPITHVRYSLSDEDIPVDLCSDCFGLAKDFAASRRFDENESVVIRGQTLGEGFQLSCADVQNMEAVPIKNPESSESPQPGKENDSSEGDPSALDYTQAELFQRQQLFDEFTDGIFASLMTLISGELEKQALFLGPLITLVSRLSRYSNHVDPRSDRLSRLARKLVDGLSRLMQRYNSAPQTDLPTVRKLKGCILRFLEALSTLVVPDEKARGYIIHPENGSLVSSVTTMKCYHGLTPCKRALSKEGHNGRPFYCCTLKSKAHRCNFFLWCDDESLDERPLFNEAIATLIWSLISQFQQKNSSPLSSVLCSLVKQLMERLDHSSVRIQGDDHSAQRIIRKMLSDFSDGAWCSLERLHNITTPQVLFQPKKSDQGQQLDLDFHIIDTCFELMALVAGTRHGDHNDSDWFSPLCTVLLSEEKEFEFFRPKAKRALWQLCGKEPQAFLAIRDQYLFGLHFGRVLSDCALLRNQCALVKEKSEKHVRHRRSGPEGDNELTLNLADVVGAVDLMNEDVSLFDRRATLEKALGELLSIATKRRENWSKFCFSSEGSSTPATEDVPKQDSSVPTMRGKPVDKLLVVACVLPGELQLKAMKLAFLAMPQRADPTGTSESTLTSEQSVVCKEGFQDSSLDRSCISVDDLYTFVLRFVCEEESRDIRKVAVRLVCGLCDIGHDASELLGRLSKKPLAMCGTMGKMSYDFLVLLNELAKSSSPGTLDVESLAANVCLLYQKQTIALCATRSNGETFYFETRSTSSTQKSRFDLSQCTHVVLRQPVTAARPGSSKAKRLPLQVSPFSRSRLDVGRATSSHNEFNSFVALPNRCVLSDVHIGICDPRGRFVKKIIFYSSPRPVERPSLLKTPDYEVKWQLCGSVELEKGAEQANCTLEEPVVASNIRIEYAEFYDRPGSPKSDGFVVHCPRCTRVVTNAHGVCATCGEVAFQCRRCRHINYDRLDAFLCVECGFCASGSFSYNITAAVASNAVAITNEQDYRTATQMFSTASLLCEEIKNALLSKLTQLSERNHSVTDVRMPMIGDSEALNRAFEGKLPHVPTASEEQSSDTAEVLLKRFPRRGSIVKMVAQKRKDDKSTRTPLSSATMVRQLRGESEENNEDDEDEDVFASADLLGGLLESAGVTRGLDPTDPVSRFLATMQSRSRERWAAQFRGGSHQEARDEGALTTSTTGKDKSLEECERLYRLMHEAQRECFALKRRIDAWHRMKSGNLSYAEDETAVFEPSHCSSCAGILTYQLLMLWHSLFCLDPAKVEVSDEMLRLLLTDDLSTGRGLQETKLLAVKDIAVLSEKYRPVVLEALRTRLLTFHDAHCAEIVGHVLKCTDDPAILEPFMALAQQTMESNPIM